MPIWNDENGVPVPSEPLPFEISKVLRASGVEQDAIRAIAQATESPALMKSSGAAQIGGIGDYSSLSEYLECEYCPLAPGSDPNLRFFGDACVLRKEFLAFYDVVKEDDYERITAFMRVRGPWTSRL